MSSPSVVRSSRSRSSAFVPGSTRQSHSTEARPGMTLRASDPERRVGAMVVPNNGGKSCVNRLCRCMARSMPSSGSPPQAPRRTSSRRRVSGRALHEDRETWNRVGSNGGSGGVSRLPQRGDEHWQSRLLAGVYGDDDAPVVQLEALATSFVQREVARDVGALIAQPLEARPMRALLLIRLRDENEVAAGM